jgi:hypothetical protein
MFYINLTCQGVANENKKIKNKKKSTSTYFILICFFNNILVISWWSFLLIENPEKTTADMSQATDKCYHLMVYRWLLFVSV